MTEQQQPHHQQSLLRSKRVLHWTLAAMVFFLFASSWWMLSLPLPSDEFTYRVLPFQLHKNIGLTLFLIVLVLVGFRFWQRRHKGERSRTLMDWLAAVDQWLIYVLVAAVCLSGYLSSSFSGWGTEFWWVLSLPAWAQENDALNIVFSDIHQWTCWLLLIAIVLHIAAAVYHGLRDDEALEKMFP